MRIRFLKVALTVLALTPFYAFSSEDHNLREACKSECPSAKTEDEAHKCMSDVMKKKKDDRKFKKSDCAAAYREHEKHEKEENHSH